MKKGLLLAIIAITFCSVGAISIASDLVVESKVQSYSEQDNKIKAEGDVHVKIDDAHVIGDKADVTITKDNKLDTATFYDKPYAYQVQGYKKQEVKADILKASLINKIITAEGNTQTTIFEGKEPTVIITADTQEYNVNTNVMTAQGGVVIHYKELETYSDKAVIKASKSGELKRIDLIGKARVHQDKQRANADHFIYSPETEELIAEGNVTTEGVMDDGTKLVMKSSFQQYNQKSNTFLGSGNVRIWFKDYYAQGPKVTFYPDKASKKPNEIYFVGRSSITEDLKTIYADHIKMVLKPKTFYAEGNTKTLIRDIGNPKNSENNLF